MTLRLAVLGHGFIGDLHTRAAREAGAEVVVVAGRNLERARAFAERHDIARATDDWMAAVTADDVDAVVIGTPNALHHPQALAAIAAGRHILVDKPMATTVAEATEIRDAAAEAGVVVCVGHMWRYRDEVVDLRDRIAAGALGTVVRTRGYGIHARWGPSGWFTDPTLAGGGALIDMGIHAIDTVRFLLGDPDPRRVVASLGRAHGTYDDTIDDDGVVLIDWEGGVRSVVESGWWQPVLDGVEADTEVFGTIGHARIWPMYTTTSPPPADYEHCTLPMYTAQMADFLACARNGGTPVASAEVGLEALRIVAAAYRSAGELSLTPRPGGTP